MTREPACHKSCRPVAISRSRHNPISKEKSQPIVSLTLFYSVWPSHRDLTYLGRAETVFTAPEQLSKFSLGKALWFEG